MGPIFHAHSPPSQVARRLLVSENSQDLDLQTKLLLGIVTATREAGCSELLSVFLVSPSDMDPLSHNVFHGGHNAIPIKSPAALCPS